MKDFNEQEIYLLNQELNKLKADNEELCDAIKYSFHKQYERHIISAESDILWGELDRNATQAQFCKGVIYSTRNYIARLKAENKELKKEIEEIREDCDCCFNAPTILEQQYEQCLDNIKEICNCNDTLQGDFNIVDCDKYQLGKHNLADKILQKIKEVKGNRL